MARASDPDPERLATSLTRSGSTLTLHLVGELDAATVAVLVDLLDVQVDDDVTVLELDLSRVSFVDSSGLTSFVQAKQRMADRSGQVVLVAPQPVVVRVLDITGLTDSFSIR